MRRFLPFEQVVRAVGQVQQLDAFLNVGLVGDLVRRDVAQEAVLLGAPLGRLGVEEGRVDPAVELVQVHGVDAALEAAVLGLESGDGFVVEGYLAGPTSIDLTTAWQRFKITGTLAGGQTGLWIVVRQFAGNGDNWTSGAIYLWGACLQHGNDPKNGYARTWASQTTGSRCGPSRFGFAKSRGNCLATAAQ